MSVSPYCCFVSEEGGHREVENMLIKERFWTPVSTLVQSGTLTLIPAKKKNPKHDVISSTLETNITPNHTLVDFHFLFPSIKTKTKKMTVVWLFHVLCFVLFCFVLFCFVLFDESIQNKRKKKKERERERERERELWSILFYWFQHSTF